MSLKHQANLLLDRVQGGMHAAGGSGQSLMTPTMGPETGMWVAGGAECIGSLHYCRIHAMCPPSKGSVRVSYTHRLHICASDPLLPKQAQSPLLHGSTECGGICGVLGSVVLHRRGCGWWLTTLRGLCAGAVRILVCVLLLTWSHASGPTPGWSIRHPPVLDICEVTSVAPVLCCCQLLEPGHHGQAG